MAERLTGWGRTSPALSDVVRITEAGQVADALRAAPGRGVIARGLGRSYGDPAQNSGGLVLDLTGLDRIRDLTGIDPASGEEPTVAVDAGVSLDTLMRTLLPLGLWVPVLPGTRQVTVGGAIAADVHGKNHHVDGSFGNHVLGLSLVTADGADHRLTPDDDLFWATVGGMGLTGVVTGATLRLTRVETAYFAVDTDRTRNLTELMTLFESDPGELPYSVAWFDSITSGDRLGRAVLTRGRSARRDELPADLQAQPLRFAAPSLGRVPDVFPSGLVNRVTGRAFNELWFRKAPAHRRSEVQDITTFFHPLDIVSDWNRLYGRRGFAQYQFVMPFGAEDAFQRAVRLIADSGQTSCLNVLKTFGSGNRGLLSFPTSGWTLAVDLPVTPDLGRLCDALDALVVGAGGRIYLAKDSRLTAETMAAMYPRLDDFRRIREEIDPDGVFVSDQARRLRL